MHVGAHKGQEVEDYNSEFSNPKIHLFEPQKIPFEYLQSRYGSFENIRMYNFGLGSSNTSKKMYISNNDGQSSSFLKPKEHLAVHPEIQFSEDSTQIEIKVFDDLNIANVELLNIDTQGFELEVLKGFHKSLVNDINYIILEVNKKELYDGCPLVNDIDNYQSKYNFIII